MQAHAHALPSDQRPPWRTALAHRLPFAVGVVLALVIGIGPLAARQYMADEPAELRLRLGAEHLAAVVADGDARVAILDLGDRELTRELQGALLRTLDPDMAVVIAPANDNAARGLLTWLEGGTPTDVIIAGVPGADAIWSELEQLADTRGFQLHYVSDRVTLDLPTLTLTVFGNAPDADAIAAVIVRDDTSGASVMLDLGAGAGALASIDRTVTVTRRTANTGDVVILPAGSTAGGESAMRTRVLMDGTTTARLRFDGAQLRISDGTVVQPTRSASSDTAP